MFSRIANDITDIKQGPWKTLDSGHMRRDFEYNIDKTGLLGMHHQPRF
jgi:hypothetical protein